MIHIGQNKNMEIYKKKTHFSDKLKIWHTFWMYDTLFSPWLAARNCFTDDEGRGCCIMLENEKAITK